jgi:hypothetical protein
MSAGCPPGPPVLRQEAAPQSARSSPGCGYIERDRSAAAYMARTSGARYPETSSCRNSPQAAFMAPPRSMIPQPHFSGRSACGARSVTPPRVLAR